MLFDFQATGDFLLAEIDPDFVVQTRQKSGAPRWPNASVNTAVAIKVGDTRAALCLDPNRLVVNGTHYRLSTGGSLSLSDVTITRKDNVYLFKRPDGASLTATLRNGWINASIRLGSRATSAKVRGLLGNANGNTGEVDLATRNGRVLPHPISFQDLYQVYGDSWRFRPVNRCRPSSAGVLKLNGAFLKSRFTRTTLGPENTTVRERVALRQA